MKNHSRKAPKSSLSCSIRTLMGYTMQMISKILKAFAMADSLTPLAKFVYSYILFDSEKIRLLILSKPDKEFALREQL